MQHRLPALARPRELRVVVGDRGRDHDLGVRWHRGGVMAHAGVQAGGSQPLHVGAV